VRRSRTLNERMLLLVNRRVIRLGGWNAVVVLAALSRAYKRGKVLTIPSIAKLTGLSSGSVHHLLRALTRSNLIVTTRSGKIVSRNPSPLGLRKLRELCDLPSEN